MSLVSLIHNKVYQSYKAWIFLKDWILLFVVTMLIMSGVWLITSFVTWNMMYWEYFKVNVWMYTRWSIIISFLLELYFFSASYNETLIILGLKKRGE